MTHRIILVLSAFLSLAWGLSSCGPLTDEATFSGTLVTSGLEDAPLFVTGPATLKVTRTGDHGQVQLDNADASQTFDMGTTPPDAAEGLDFGFNWNKVNGEWSIKVDSNRRSDTIVNESISWDNCTRTTDCSPGQSSCAGYRTVTSKQHSYEQSVTIRFTRVQGESELPTSGHADFEGVRRWQETTRHPSVNCTATPSYSP